MNVSALHQNGHLAHLATITPVYVPVIVCSHELLQRITDIVQKVQS